MKLYAIASLNEGKSDGLFLLWDREAARGEGEDAPTFWLREVFNFDLLLARHTFVALGGEVPTQLIFWVDPPEKLVENGVEIPWSDRLTLRYKLIPIEHLYEDEEILNSIFQELLKKTMEPLST